MSSASQIFRHSPSPSSTPMIPHTFVQIYRRYSMFICSLFRRFFLPDIYVTEAECDVRVIGQKSRGCKGLRRRVRPLFLRSRGASVAGSPNGTRIFLPHGFFSFFFFLREHARLSFFPLSVTRVGVPDFARIRIPDRTTQRRQATIASSSRKGAYAFPGKWIPAISVTV